MFALELNRRSVAQGWGVMSNAAHPGWATTDLIANGPAATGRAPLLWELSKLAAPFFSQSAAAGALPTLFAATSPNAEGGGYYGPVGAGEMKGPPGPARIAPQAREQAAASRLWELSESLTGLRDEAAPRAA
jgi:hypothetical protein